VIVIDASVAVVFLVQSEGREALNDLMTKTERIIVPTLFDYEVGSALRRLCLAGAIDESRARLALTELGALMVERNDVQDHLMRMWQLRSNISFYDAAYVALAELLALPLYSFDAKVIASTGHKARISRP
jgi:predicted nucleic acid-binding protein